MSFFIFQIISGCGGYYPQAAIHSAETTEHTLISAEILQKFLGFCRKIRILQNSAEMQLRNAQVAASQRVNTHGISNGSHFLSFK